MLSCYKYDIPEGMSEEEIKELRVKIDRISKSFDEWLANPEAQEKVRRNARLAGTIRPCDLYREFTI